MIGWLGRVMHRRTLALVFTGLLCLLLLMAGCRRASTTPTPLTSPTSGVGEGIAPSATQAQAYPQPTSRPSAAPPSGQPSPQPTASVESQFPGTSPTSAYPAPQVSATATTGQKLQASQTAGTATTTPTATAPSASQYPGPQATYTVPAYPGPSEQVTSTSAAYPGPGTASPAPTRTPPRSATPTPASGTVFPTPSVTLGTGTPGATPTELPPRRPLAPPPAGSNITIWHAWNPLEVGMLKEVVLSFQRAYPDVTFNLVYIPMDDLFDTYQEASYLGHGPSLLLGPAQWGPELFDGQLVTDLEPYVPGNYLSSLTPAALDSGRYRDALISLPLSQHGMVMLRNTSIISSAPKSFEELASLSHQATRAGNVGSYLERGAYFSAPGLLGLGGKLFDDNDMPEFNDSSGLMWLDMLRAYDDAGAVTINTNRDLNMFMRGRVGIIIDGTWNIQTLSQAIGPENLAIDPWPTYGSGHLSGWVEADSIFLNSNTSGNDRFAALTFIGYLLDPDVQMRLAEVGHIPSVSTTIPRDPLFRQAMEAFSSGVAYPITVRSDVLNIYWVELDAAIRDVFVNGVRPVDALKAASEGISLILINSQSTP